MQSFSQKQRFSHIIPISRPTQDFSKGEFSPVCVFTYWNAIHIQINKNATQRIIQRSRSYSNGDLHVQVIKVSNSDLKAFQVLRPVSQSTSSVQQMLRHHSEIPTANYVFINNSATNGTDTRGQIPIWDKYSQLLGFNVSKNNQFPLVFVLERLVCYKYSSTQKFTTFVT